MEASQRAVEAALAGPEHEDKEHPYQEEGGQGCHQRQHWRARPIKES